MKKISEETYVPRPKSQTRLTCDADRLLPVDDVHIVPSYDESAYKSTKRSTPGSSDIPEDNEIVGMVLRNKRRIKTVIRRRKPRAVNPAQTKKRELIRRLSHKSRRAKWESFENSDIENFVLSASAIGYEVCLVTLKLPLRNWLPYAPTPAALKDHLNRWMRKVGGKRRFGVPGFDKPIYCLSVLEFKVEGDKAPHIHLVMMLPVGADGQIRELWKTQLRLPDATDADDVVHVSRRYSGGDDPVESFRQASRYLCGKKGRQELVCPSWLTAELEVGKMWSVRGFAPYKDDEYELLAGEVDRTKAVLEAVSTRPRYRLDGATGELKRNSMARHQPDSPNGNTEVLGNRTGEVLARIAATNGWSLNNSPGD